MRMAAVVLGFLVFAPAASAYSGVRLTVNGRGGVLLSAEDISRAQDVSGDTHTTTRSADGREMVDQIGGTRSATLVELARIPRSFVRELRIDRVGAPGSVVLSGDEVRNGFHGDPLGGRRDATFYGGYGNGVRFFRPLRDADDTNDRDDITPSGNADLQLALTTTNDTVRTVDADADDATPDPNAPANFTARVEDPPGDGTSFAYSWDFGDGRSEAGATPTHAFAAGHYRVTVTAVGNDGSSGVSEPIDIQVGKPGGEAAPAPTRTAAPPETAGPIIGGNDDGPGAGKAPPGGGGAPANQGTSGPRRSDGHDDTTRKPHQAQTAAPTTTPAAAAQASAAPTTSPAATAAPDKPTPTPTATASPGPATRAPARPIDGVLLAGAGDPTKVGRVIQSVTSSQRAPSRRGGGGGGSVAGWLGGGSLLLLLFAGGAAAELRGVRL